MQHCKQRATKRIRILKTLNLCMGKVIAFILQVVTKMSAAAASALPGYDDFLVPDLISWTEYSKFCNKYLMSTLPMTMTLLTHGRATLMLSSMGTGGTFSPPAVMRISLILPVMETKPSSLITPTSPLLKKPSSPSSRAAFVFSGSFKYLEIKNLNYHKAKLRIFTRVHAVFIYRKSS